VEGGGNDEIVEMVMAWLDGSRVDRDAGAFGACTSGERSDDER
jgi:hypothetical protein